MLENVKVQNGNRIEAGPSTIIAGNSVKVFRNELYGVDLSIVQRVLEVVDTSFDNACSLHA